jgi:tRNA-specific 2-thiouridylase
MVVAMSGGVDSSVAAALLVQAGHEVVGVSMQLYDQQASDHRFGSCCTIDDLHDARRVARHLGIPHYIVNLEREFEEAVIGNFVREYAAGRTPIPCAHCNSELKFAEVLRRARGYAAAAVATGHYARITCDGDGRRRLRRGVDPGKDQSYVLFGLTQEQLAGSMFPLGHLAKPDVRRLAGEFGLAVADKRDSHEICFVPDGDYASFVGRHLGTDSSGLIIDAHGRVVGRHAGVHHFTVGQRKGLGLATGEPLYVIALDAAERLVHVGPKSALERTGLTASGVNWISGNPCDVPRRVTAQIRYRHAAAPATLVKAEADRVAIDFDSPQVAITPGQAAVWYDGDEVIGGGWIDAATS